MNECVFHLAGDCIGSETDEDFLRTATEEIMEVPGE